MNLKLRGRKPSIPNKEIGLPSWYLTGGPEEKYINPQSGSIAGSRAEI
jgi:hypothetical protein